MKLCQIYLEAARTLEDLHGDWHIVRHEAAGHVKFNITDGRGNSQGHMMLKRVRIPAEGRKLALWIITIIESKPDSPYYSTTHTPFTLISGKFGPLLYDLAIEYATSKGEGLLPAEALTHIFARAWNSTDNEQVTSKQQNIARAKADGFYYTKSRFRPYELRSELSVGTPMYLNFTSPDAKRVYERLYTTRRGLTGPIIMQDALKYKKPHTAFNPHLVQKLYGIPVRYLYQYMDRLEQKEQPEEIDPNMQDAIVDLLEEAKRDGWDGNGFPKTKRMSIEYTKEWANKYPYLSVIYTKPPVATIEAERLGILVDGVLP